MLWCLRETGLKEETGSPCAAPRQDYRSYEPSLRERLGYYGAACAACAFLALLFYRSLIAMALSLAVPVFTEKLWWRRQAERRRLRLQEGFREVLYSLSGAVAAGRQLPAAVEEAAGAAASDFGADSDIAVEMGRIAASYRDLHAEVDRLLCDFGIRSGVEEIRQFAGSCSVCVRCGGDLEDVCLKSAELLLEKIAFSAEAEALIAQKKLDMLLLTAMPVLILLFLNLLSPSYISLLYEGLTGRLIMTGCLAGIGAALYWGLKITDVKV